MQFGDWLKLSIGLVIFPFFYFCIILHVVYFGVENSKLPLTAEIRMNIYFPGIRVSGQKQRRRVRIAGNIRGVRSHDRTSASPCLNEIRPPRSQ